MFNVSSYLEKFRKMEPQGDTEKRAAVKAITEAVGIEIERNSMNVLNGVLFLSVPPALKNEIYMNKSEIVQKISDILGDKRIKDIR